MFILIHVHCRLLVNVLCMYMYMLTQYGVFLPVLLEVVNDVVGYDIKDDTQQQGDLEGDYILKPGLQHDIK